MKNKLKLFGVIAVVAIIGYSLVGCGIGTGPQAVPPITLYDLDEGGWASWVTVSYPTGTTLAGTFGNPNLTDGGVAMVEGPTGLVTQLYHVATQASADAEDSIIAFDITPSVTGYANVVFTFTADVTGWGGGGNTSGSGWNNAVGKGKPTFALKVTDDEVSKVRAKGVNGGKPITITKIVIE